MFFKSLPASFVTPNKISLMRIQKTGGGYTLAGLRRSNPFSGVPFLAPRHVSDKVVADAHAAEFKKGMTSESAELYYHPSDIEQRLLRLQQWQERVKPRVDERQRREKEEEIRRVENRVKVGTARRLAPPQLDQA